MIVFIECVDVTVRDLAIRDSTCWSLFFHGCRDVQVRGVRIENDILNKNTDGIDIDSCANVVIADCLIRTGDDAITLRGVDRLDRLAADAPSRICENVVVSNCVCSVSATAMRIGVGNGTIRHVLISNLMVAHAGIGLHIQSSYSGEGKGVAISDIRFANIDIRDCSSPVYVVGGTAFATSPVRNISFRGLTGEGFMPITVRGSGDKASGRTRPAHIRFEDVRLVIQGDAPALLVEHADDIHFANVRAERPDGTPIPTERLIKSEDATVEIVSGTPKRAGAQAD
jgi:polygalacturonase